MVIVRNLSILQIRLDARRQNPDFMEISVVSVIRIGFMAIHSSGVGKGLTPSEHSLTFKSAGMSKQRHYERLVTCLYNA